MYIADIDLKECPENAETCCGKCGVYLTTTPAATTKMTTEPVTTTGMCYIARCFSLYVFSESNDNVLTRNIFYVYHANFVAFTISNNV